MINVQFQWKTIIEFLKKICTKFFFCKVRNVRKWLLPVSYWNLGRKIGVFFIYCFFHTQKRNNFLYRDVFNRCLSVVFFLRKKKSRKCYFERVCVTTSAHAHCLNLGFKRSRCWHCEEKVLIHRQSVGLVSECVKCNFNVYVKFSKLEHQH